MTALEIAREYFPGWSDYWLEGIIWEETGYPCFWPSSPAEDCFRLQLAKAASRELYGEYGYFDSAKYLEMFAEQMRRETQENVA